jgi:small subunit ribosomal protein S5
MKRSAEVTKDEANEAKVAIVAIRRVAKVVKGGRRFTFAAVVIVGDGRGRVGYGLGKAKEVMEARAKAEQAAKRAMVKVQLREGRTIHHDVKGHFGSGTVVLRSAAAGTGIIAGGPMRAIFTCLGIHDIVAKSIGSSNTHNMVRATFDAFASLTSPKLVAEKRGKRVGEIIERRETGSSSNETVSE